MTYFLTAGEVKKEWLLVDASEVILGRLCAYIVTLLKGKHKPAYTPNLDCGDQVVVVNAGKVALSGNKFDGKVYYRHTGYPGSIKMFTPNDILSGPDPAKLVRWAVQRMLGYGPMSRKRLKNLYVYAGPEHENEAQKPRQLDFISMNRKNKGV